MTEEHVNGGGWGWGGEREGGGRERSKVSGRRGKDRKKKEEIVGGGEERRAAGQQRIACMTYHVIFKHVKDLLQFAVLLLRQDDANKAIDGILSIRRWNGIRCNACQIDGRGNCIIEAFPR